MTVSPEGLPAWERAASIETYGGNVDKQNVEGLTAFNPKTQVSAEQLSSAVDHLLAATRVMPFAVISLTCNDTATEDPTVTAYRGQHAVGVNFAPTVERIADGYASIEWEDSYADSYGIEGSVNLTMVKATLNDADGGICNAWLVDSHTIYFHARNLAGASVQDAKVTIEVWT